MRKLSLILLILVLGVGFLSAQNAQTQTRSAVVEAGLRETILANGQGQYLVYLKDQADLSAAQDISDWTARGQYVYTTLWNKANETQAGLLAFLGSQQATGDTVRYRAFYIVNAVAVTSGVNTLDALAARPDIDRIESSKTYQVVDPIRLDPTAGPQALEWGVAKINADDIWTTFGTTGEGIVVANIDTGVQYNHPALVNQYRGTTSGSHDYNWFDPSAICSPGVPCDNNGHGTHTMGTMVGDDGGANQIGVAPGAQWIAAKGCESNSCSDTALLASAEWILAPYPIGGTPAQGDPAKRPNVVNNSWGGGGGDTWYQASVQAWRASSIFPAFSAGNSGPGGGTIGSPGDYAESYASGATDINDIIASFSSRGPSSLTNETKPDVSAPGVDVRSSVPTNSYGFLSGTSMASPHTSGCAALLYSIDPTLTIEEVEDLMTSTAVDLGAPGPDFDYGYGRIDCFAAASQLNPDFTIAASPSSLSVCVPTSADYLVNIGSISGFDAPVTLSASGNPAGTTTNFTVNPVIPAGSSTLTVGNMGVAAAGDYTIQITGDTTTSTHSVDVGLSVYTGSPGSITLLSPADGATNVSLAPTLSWTAANQGDTYEVQVATDAGFANIVYNNIADDTSHTLTSPLDPLTLHYWRVRPVNPCGQGSYSAAFSFTTADIPPILVVDDDDNAPDVRSYYTDALDAVGADYDIWDTQNSDNEPTTNDLAPYILVIWFTGVEFGGFAGPGFAGETALSSWLDNGSCLFISSQDYLYDRGLTSFMDNYLGLSTFASDVAQNNVTGQGIVFGGYGPYALSYPFTNFSDHLAPDGDAEVAFLGDAFQPEAAVAKDGGAYKTTFWGFPFEAISNLNDRADLMTQIVNWCGGGITVGTLAGHVSDLDSGLPIANATITADNGSTIRVTTTNANGDYSMNMATGTYDVTASKANYVSVTEANVEINDGATTVVDFQLQGSSLDYSPPNIEEFMEIGDIVTNTVTINATGPLPVDFSVSFGNFGGPSLQIPASPIHIPASNGNFPRGTAAPSVGAAPKSDRPGNGDSTLVLPGGALAYGLQIDLNTFAFDLSSFTTNDPANLNVIGSTGPDLLPGGDFINGDFSKMYVLDYDANQLITVDTASAAITVIGSSVPTGAHSWTGVAGDPTDGTLYAASCDITQTAIYTLDTNTGTASLIGTTATAPCLIGIAIDASGQMYGYDIVTDSLYSVDKTTGAATTIGSLGFDANFSQGMDFDEGTGILYLAAYNNSSGSGELRVADTATGNTTLVGLLGGTGLVEMNSMAVATGGVSSNWVYAVPDSGTVPANGNTTIDVVFDARSLYQVGDYTAEMKFSGTFVNVVPPMPLTMHLSCPSCGFLDGSVFDDSTGDPLAASVHVTGPNGFDVTLNGETYALAVQPGTYDLEASATGYLPDSAQVNVAVGQTVTTDFYLVPDVAVLEYAPPAIEEFMEIGDIVTNTVYVTNTGAHQLDYSVHIGNYGGPSLGYSDGNFLRGTAAPSVGPAPRSEAPAGISNNPIFPLVGGSLAYGLQIDLNTFAFELSSFSTDDPATLNIIGSTGADLMVGGDFLNGDFSTLYVLDYDANMLVAVDTATSAVTPIGSSFPTGAHTWTGLANDPTSGQLYAASCDITQTAIYTIDVGTGTATLVGTTFDAPCLIGIAMNAAGEMYGHDIVTDSLYRVDKTNGSVTMVGSLGYDANFSQGMDFDEETGILYLAAYNNGTGSGELRIADTTTGNTTLVGPFGGTGLVELNSMAVATGGSAAQWASAVPDSGSIPPYSSGTFEVVFDARSMVQTGDFTAQLTFSGNFVNTVPPMDLTMHLSCPTCGFLDGSVTDAGTGDPLNAEIHVTGPNGFDVTLHDDAYALAVQPGDYDFTVSANGYVGQSATVTASQGATVTTDFALLPAAATLTYSPNLIEETVAWGDSVNNTLTISNIGTIGFDFSLADFQTGSPFGLEAVQQPAVTCPPDSFGYTCVDSNEAGGPIYNWVEIAPPAGGSGTLINFPSPDDDYYWPIDLPFSFRFYGIDYNQLAVATNGTVYFQDAYLGFGNTAIPSSTGYGVDTYIGGFWDDLYVSPGSVYYLSEPNRVIIEHYQTSTCCVSPDSATWQMILSSDGNILFQYQDVTFGTGSDYGASGTIGIQGDAVTGVQYSYNTASLAPELAICFPYPGSGDPTCGGLDDAAWATENPDNGTVDAGASTDVTVTFDSSVVTATGTYTATLIFDGTFENDVEPATLVMHVVDAAPAIELTTTVSTDGSCGLTNAVSVAWGSDVTYCYTVTNIGNVMLNSHTLTDDQLGTLLNGAAYDLQPGDSYSYLTTVTIDPPAPPFPSNLTNCATWVATRDALSATSNEACATVTISAPTDVSLTGFGQVASGTPAVWLAATLLLVAGLALALRRKVAR